MAADIALRLISRSIRDRNIGPLLELNVDETWWPDDESLQLWKYAKDHYSRYGECPSAVTVRDALPGYRLLKVEDGLPYLLDAFTGFRRRDEAIELVQDAGYLLNEGQHEEAITSLSTGLLKLTNDTGVGGTRDRVLTVGPDGTIDRYMELRSLGGGLRGYPTGFATIDRATSGLQNKQLVTIIAPPKVGKSTLALAIARNVHRLVDKDVLFVSFEMSNDEHEARYVAMVGGVSHTALMEGKLSGKQEALLRERMRATEGRAKFTLSDAPSAATVTGLAAKLEKLQPQIAFVDGVYLMQDEMTGESNTPQALTNITRGLKRLAQRFDIPIVISTQVLLWKMRKGQVSADAIGYSSSFFQDSDVILGLQPMADDEERRTLKVVSSRNCPKVDVELEWDWKHTAFTERALVVGETRYADDDMDDDE